MMKYTLSHFSVCILFIYEVQRYSFNLMNHFCIYTEK